MCDTCSLYSGFSYAKCSVVASARNSISCNTSVYDYDFLSCMLLNSPHVLYRTLYELRNEKSNRKAMNRNWSNQKSNPSLKTKTGNK